MPLTAFQIKTSHPLEREQALEKMRRSGKGGLLLNTCQRLEFYTWDDSVREDISPSRQWNDAVAFERLARIAAGLESRILGELEILGQVRAAYKSFRDAHGAVSHAKLDRIFQDALALARRARRESGIDKNLTSLASLSARVLIDHVAVGAPVAVVGTGSMAGSVARYLSKRGRSPVRVCSRCPDRAMTLALEVGGFGAGLDDLAHQLNGVAGIVCATAAPHPVVYPHHIGQTSTPLLIVDLGVPPDCDEAVMRAPHVRYMGLEAMEAQAQVNTEMRREKADIAARIIRDGALAWARAL
jgi:glutamyl-tRNA reductase